MMHERVLERFILCAEQLELFLKGEQTEDDNEPAGEFAQLRLNFSYFISLNCGSASF